jgi:predicted ATPase
LNLSNVDRFHIITGGPGSGKTSLIEALRGRGYACSTEAGRGIIQDQVSVGGSALPWHDPLLFAELMLSWEMRSYHIAGESDGKVFFDRGVPDVIGYLRLMNLPVPDHMQKAALAFRYHPVVFIAPPWQEIFRQDTERKQDFNEAIRTYQALASTYDELNYHLVELPRSSIEDRLNVVLEEYIKQ